MSARLVSLAGFCGAACCVMFIVQAAYADRIWEDCEGRDAWCSRKTFVWEVTANRALQLSKQERAILQSEPGSGEIATQVWVRGYVTVMRRPGLTYVESVHQDASHPWLLGRFSYWLSRDFVLYAPAATPNTHSPPRALVLPSPDNGLYWGFIKDGADEFTPGMHPSFFAGTNPLRTFSPFFIFNWRKGAWVSGGRQGAIAEYRFADPPVEAEIGLDETKQYAPAYLKAQRYAFRQEYKVHEWRRLASWWIPSKVEVREVTSDTVSTLVYVLKHVQDTPSDMHIVLPAGTPVKDLRHIPLETIAVEGLFVQKPVYSYAWSGSLPPKESLPVVAKESGPPVRVVNAPPVPPEGSPFPLMPAAVGLAVVAGGVVYWLLRRRGKGM